LKTLAVCVLLRRLSMIIPSDLILAEFGS
jgi:hypothetical protein